MMLLLGIAVVLALWYYPQLPERVASHFDGEGNADGWMQREGFMVFYAMLFVVLGATFAGSARLLRMPPDSMINLPNKYYWLHEERRQESIASLERSLLRMGNGTLLFMLIMMLDIFEANLQAAVRLSPLFWPVFLLYFLYLGWLIVRMYRRFSRIPSDGHAQ
jgi:uncharacterized membrane protein